MARVERGAVAALVCVGVRVWVLLCVCVLRVWGQQRACAACVRSLYVCVVGEGLGSLRVGRWAGVGACVRWSGCA